MEFIKKCAKVMADEGKHIAFTTRIGFPMHQFYREHDNKAQKVWMYDRASRTYSKDGELNPRIYKDAVNAIKSVNASSPNIIHAQDSTLLMNVVVALRSKGVTDLMTIHDSFSTTAGNMRVMRHTLLEETRKLYDGYCCSQSCWSR